MIRISPIILSFIVGLGFGLPAVAGQQANFFEWRPTSHSNGNWRSNYQILFVDCNHADLKNSTANTKNSIRADYYSGTTQIATVAWKGTDCGSSNDQLYIMESNIPFDNVMLMTDGKDAFWPDEIGWASQYGLTGNHGLSSLLDKWDGQWGRDNGGVWCLSKDKKDRPSVKNSGCFTALKFTKKKSGQSGYSKYTPPPAMGTYKFGIDCYDSSVDSSETNNLITLKLWNGTTPVPGGVWQFTPKLCSSLSQFDTAVRFNSPTFTHFTLATNGNDGYWIDRIILMPGQHTQERFQIFSILGWGKNHDEKGYCLSTDKKDSSRSWKNKISDGKCLKNRSFYLKKAKKLKHL